MKKILQINVTSNWGSTGRIAEQIGQLAILKGWESYIAYGRYSTQSKSKTIKIGSKLDVFEHYLENRLLDNEGLASRQATKRLLTEIQHIHPDIIHLHNIHDHYLNYPILFRYLQTLDIPIVWTQHDCWAFTGGCGYYSMAKCEDWKNSCSRCPQRRGVLLDRSSFHLRNKEKYFCKLNNLTIVPVSEWLQGEVEQSFLSKYPVKTILNGVDIETFAPTPSQDVRFKYGISDKKYYLAVAMVWNARKGLSDYIELTEKLASDEVIVLVGLDPLKAKSLPDNIIAIPRTQNVRDLVALYSEASIVLNLSREETFGLSTVEGFACGTPSVVYNCTASPELITSKTGRVVKEGDLEGVYAAITELNSIGKENMTLDCRSRAIEQYDKDKCFEKYVALYEELISK